MAASSPCPLAHFLPMLQPALFRSPCFKQSALAVGRLAHACRALIVRAADEHGSAPSRLSLSFFLLFFWGQFPSGRALGRVAGLSPLTRALRPRMHGHAIFCFYVQVPLPVQNLRPRDADGTIGAALSSRDCGWDWMAHGWLVSVSKYGSVRGGKLRQTAAATLSPHRWKWPKLHERRK